MIRSSTLNSNARRIAEAIFTRLAISEGKVHHIAPEDVEFHEVGAVDSIVDTVGAAIGFDALGIERFRCSPINVGGGFIHCQHGVYPVPAPATADLRGHGESTWSPDGIYHLESCRSYQSTKKPNRWFCSEDEAKAAGFRKSYSC